MKFCMFITFACVFLYAAIASASGPNNIMGVWNTAKRDAKIEIYQCGIKYCGKIVWLKESAYPAGSKDGVPGTPILDQNNPNPAMRKKPLMGVNILADFVYAGDDLWTNGKIYNSNNGKMYSGKLTLISPDRLKVRGFIGISLIGGSTIWTRGKTGAK